MVVVCVSRNKLMRRPVDLYPHASLWFVFPACLRVCFEFLMLFYLTFNVISFTLVLECH